MVSLGNRSLIFGGCLLSFKVVLSTGKTYNCIIGQMFSEEYTKSRITKLCEDNCVKIVFLEK